MNVLLIIDHAPDYRESFLRELSKYVNLTVGAQPCEQEQLLPPDDRVGYDYYEFPSISFKGFIWQSGLGSLLYKKKWDIICFDLNLRHLNRIAIFLKEKKNWDKWIWWGHIIGKNKSNILDNVRRYLLTRSAGCLTYNEEIVEQLRTRYGIDAYSFNNTQVLQNEFRHGVFTEHPEIRLLFVGRYQTRKRLERLILLASRRSDIHVRLIGPGMDQLKLENRLLDFGRFEIFPRISGEDLNSHFDWADIIANPGHVGLLVMNAAKHGKGIVIDSKSLHAPEYLLAKESEQPFINFSDDKEVDKFIDEIIKDRAVIHNYGKQLQEVAIRKYTIEAMANTHYSLFRTILNTTHTS